MTDLNLNLNLPRANELNIRGCCNVGYPSETYLKLRSREISFVQISRFSSSSSQVLHSARQYHCHKWCKISKRFGKIEIRFRPKILRGIWIYDAFRTDQYNDVIISAMASQITRLTIVYSTVYLGEDQRKHQSSASLAFGRGIHRWPVNSPHRGPATRKMFPFDDLIMQPVLQQLPGLHFNPPIQDTGWRSISRLLLACDFAPECYKVVYKR